jgi:chromosome segregation ATPase
MKKGDRLCKKIFWAFLAVLWLTTAAFGQPQQDTSQSSQQSSQQSSSQTQTEQKKSEAGGDATKKSEKEKAKPKKVYTEEDLSGMRGNGVSIVGDEKPAGGGAAGAKKAAGKPRTGVVPMSGRDEAYWRGKARVLLDQIAATELQIAKLKDDIKKYGTGGFDVTTGMKNNVAYIEDWNGQVKDLERKKADLEKKVDQLQEEGRKAGAEPAWFR